MLNVNAQPLVSIIMPTYNCGKYISESIESVINQTYRNWELEIVDDCSTDNTLEVLQPYIGNWKNIHYYCLKKNSGPAVARSEAMTRAKGKYVAFLDSDDLWLPQKLQKQIEYMEKRGALFTATGYRHIDVKGNKRGVVFFPPQKTDYKKMIRLSDPLGNLTVVYNQEVLGKYKVPLIKKRNDYALWLKILKDVDYCYGIEEVLAEYRVRSDSLTNKKIHVVKYQWELYRKVEKMNFLKAAYGIFCWAVVKGTGIGLDKRKE